MVLEPISLVKGIAMGFGAGLSPGPTNVLVIHQTIKYGLIEGLKVAISPLITDVPIICVCVWVIAKLPNPNWWVAILGSAGGLYLTHMALQLWRHSDTGKINSITYEVGSFKMGVTANLFNPGPWIHWLTIGVPLLAEANKRGQLAGFLTIGGMLLAVVGGKFLIALLAKYFGAHSGNRLHLILYRVSALLLAMFAMRFLYSGIIVFRRHA